MANKHRLSFVFDHVGEYHVSRINHCARVLANRDVAITVIEATTGKMLYTHRQRPSALTLRGVDHVAMRSSGDPGATEVELWSALGKSRPTHILTIGYNDRLALTALAYGKLHGIPVFFMGDSKADDQPRRRITERIKALVLRFFDGALVAGARHREYFQSLGMATPIETGFDVVDNAFFARQAQRWDRRADGLIRRGLLPERYVLCVSRLVERKRVETALEIFARSGVVEQGMRFVLIGSGPCLDDVMARARALGIEAAVCHYADLRNPVMPLFYARATALILASEYDQWGLCVNEAQAVGIPCIVTQRCGVANEIIHDGDNGYIFTPDTVDHAVEGLRRIVNDADHRAMMAGRARDVMESWGLDRYAHAVGRLIGVEAEP